MSYKIMPEDNSQQLEEGYQNSPQFIGNYASNNQGRTINEQMTDTAPIIRQMDNYMRGIKKIRTDTGIKTIKGSPILPEPMIDKIMMHLQTRYNPHTPLCNFNSETIHKMCKEFGELLTEWICNSYYDTQNNVYLDDNRKRITLEKKDIKFIISNLHAMYFTLLSRGKDGKTQAGILGVNTVSYPMGSMEQPQHSGGGRLEWLKRWIGG